MYDVIIVGGGAAGLMAAKILSAAGKKILLLEARENLGGRIHQLKEFSIAGGRWCRIYTWKFKDNFCFIKRSKS